MLSHGNVFGIAEHAGDLVLAAGAVEDADMGTCASIKRFFADGTCIRFIPENKHLLPIVVRAGEADTMIVGRLLKTIRSFE